MQRLVQNDQMLARQTSEWIEVLKAPKPSERAAFVEWLKESPRHVREYLLMAALEQELAAVDGERRQDVKVLLAQGSRNVVSLGGPISFESGVRARSARSRHRLALAAGLLLIVAVPWLAFSLWGWQSFATNVGEQRTVELSDGSLVQLNARSRVKVRVTDTVRDIRLMEGEATFKVQRDATRAFRVYTEDATIQAVGTQFNVRRSSGRTQVSVLEGIVKVSTQLNGSSETSHLAAGEEARIVTPGHIARVAHPDVAASTAWRQRRLIFRSRALAEMVTEFNRYNRSPRLRWEGAKVGARRYTGTFDADDPAALALLLSQERDLSVERGAGEIVIRLRPQLAHDQ